MKYTTLGAFIAFIGSVAAINDQKVFMHHQQNDAQPLLHGKYLHLTDIHVSHYTTHYTVRYSILY